VFGTDECKTQDHKKHRNREEKKSSAVAPLHSDKEPIHFAEKY
jgi:hypothetical protein